MSHFDLGYKLMVFFSSKWKFEWKLGILMLYLVLKYIFFPHFSLRNLSQKTVCTMILSAFTITSNSICIHRYKWWVGLANIIFLYVTVWRKLASFLTALFGDVLLFIAIRSIRICKKERSGFERGLTYWCWPKQCWYMGLSQSFSHEHFHGSPSRLFWQKWAELGISYL